MKSLVLLLTTSLMAMEAWAATHDNGTDSWSLLHDMANPNGELGWSANAQGVSLPDSEAIRDNLTSSQEEDIVQQTIKRIDATAFQGVVFKPSTPDDETQETPVSPTATPDAQASQWSELVSQLAPHNT